MADGAPRLSPISGAGPILEKEWKDDVSSLLQLDCCTPDAALTGGTYILHFCWMPSVVASGLLLVLRHGQGQTWDLGLLGTRDERLAGGWRLEREIRRYSLRHCACRIRSQNWKLHHLQLAHPDLQWLPPSASSSLTLSFSEGKSAMPYYPRRNASLPEKERCAGQERLHQYHQYNQP